MLTRLESRTGAITLKQYSVLDVPDIFLEPEPFVAIFQAFFDESGKFKDKHVISFCGLAAPLDKVRSFDDEWNGILRGYGLPYLTMKRALRRNIRFSSAIRANSVQERNEVLKPFTECIRKHFEFGRVVVIDVHAYAAWNPQARRKVGGSDDPHYFAFLCGVTGITKYLSTEGDRFSLICDDDQSTALNCYKLYSRVKTVTPDVKRKMISITFADDEHFPSLQAADLLASICRQEGARQFHQDYYEYVPTFQNLTGSGSGMYWGVSFYDADHLNSLGHKLVKRS